MIDYFKGIYGINLLFRIHGSALYKGSLVGILSVFIYLAIELRWNEYTRDELSQPTTNSATEEDGSSNLEVDEDLGHPYGVGVLVGSVTFLIIFRANSGYSRYWEACVSFCLLCISWL